MNGTDRTTNLVTEIISSYENHSSTELARLDYLPDRNEIIDILAILRKILFPGYFIEGKRDTDKLEQATADLLNEVEEKLSRQICHTLNLDGNKEKDCTNHLGCAGTMTRRFLSRIPHVIELLITDVQAAFDGDPAAKTKHEIIFSYPGVLAISIYRLAHELHVLSIPLIPRIMTEYAHSLTGIDIHPGAKIGPYFFIDHGTGVVIGETTTIGQRAKIYQGVTLGAVSLRGGQSLRDVKRHPTLEENVTIYAGATILGGETVIGSNSVIGGNTFIMESIPANTRVVLKQHELELVTKITT